MIGISPGDGAPAPRVISNSNAEMVFTGELINADKALRSASSRKPSSRRPYERSKGLAERIADNPPHAPPRNYCAKARTRTWTNCSNYCRIQCDAANCKITATSTTWSAEFRHVRKQSVNRGLKRRSRPHHRADLPGYELIIAETLRSVGLTRLREGGQISGRPDRDAVSEHDTAVDVHTHALIQVVLVASFMLGDGLHYRQSRARSEANDVRAGRNLPRD